MSLLIVILIAVVTAVYIFMHLPKFGALPSGDNLNRIKKSKNYKDGRFDNLSPTPALTEGATYYGVLKKFFFQQSKRRIPAQALPHSKTNLHNLPLSQNVLVWFGHSSYYMQVDGKRFLIDPVMSGAASPLSFTTRSFAGTDIYRTEDIPPIDYLFISHDHWDHLDYKTILALKPKVGKVICGLGVGTHLIRWGYATDIVMENDWDETFELAPGFSVTTVSARHFSGRTFKRNTSLWLSFALTTPSLKIFMGGDSGYDAHFKKAGDHLGSFDLAILECGQYDLSWKYIHMLPPQVLQAAKDLGAKRLLPVHWAKFALANHDWDTPINELTVLNEGAKIPLVTPKIGEAVWLDDKRQHFGAWWVGID